MKKLYTPYLSSSLSSGGKSAMTRLSNILSPSFKRGGALLIAFALVGSAFVGCKKADFSITGTENPSESRSVSSSDLYALKTPYVGDASSVGRITKAIVKDPRLKWNGMELQTKSEPYGLILNYTSEEADLSSLKTYSPLFFALIDNIDSLTFRITDSDGELIEKTYLREEADTEFSKPIAELSKTKEGFDEILSRNSAALLDAAVASAILFQNKGHFLEGECVAEGHVILGTEQKGSRIYAYTLAKYNEYGFEDGVFTVVSGSGNIPVLMIFDLSYNLIEYRQAKDGSYYEESIREMFPKEYAEKALTQTDGDQQITNAMSHAYARAYLKKIGRFDDNTFEQPEKRLLTDCGISVEVSNKMAENKELANYPYWIGNLEKIEDGARYIYEFRLDGNIFFEKFKYPKSENPTPVESFCFDAKTGKERVHPLKQ